MTTIEKIEDKALEYAKLGLDEPDIVFVSRNIYSDLLLENQQHHSKPIIGQITISIVTTVAELRVKVRNEWPNDNIVVGDHPIITILQKLGGII
jgi:hypothetical protein